MTDNNNGEPIKRTLKQKKFIEAYIENNGNATKAFMACNPNVKESSARELGSRMLTKVDISIVEILDKIGLSDPALSKILLDGLSATRESGRGINKKEILDHTIISKYIDMVFKLKASYPADRSRLELTGKDGQPIGGTNIIVTLVRKVYQDCPLKGMGKCPVEEEVDLLDPPKKRKNPFDQKEEDQEND